MHRCCPPATEASIETTICNSVPDVRQANSVSECQEAAENLIVEYKIRASIPRLYGKGCMCLSSNTVRCSEDVNVARRAASKLGATNDAAGRSA